MKLTFSKVLVIALLSLIFIGQGMAASVMSYKMARMTMNGKMQHSMMTENTMHDPHAMHNMEMTSDDSMEGCCVSSCDCTTSACSLAATVPNVIQDHRLISLFGKIDLVDHQHISFTPSSLFRPPIFS